MRSVDAAARAGACGPLWITARAEPTVPSIQAVGICEIDRRFETLTTLGAAVDASQTLTDDHQAALARILDSTTTGLRALRAAIQSDTTVQAALEDGRRIFEDFRVYLVVARQVWLVRGADTVDATVDRFATTTERLAAAIEAAEAGGKDVAEARKQLGLMSADVAAASKAVDGVAADVLAVSPSSWNDGAGEQVLRDARSAISDAAHDLRSAMAAARAVMAAIR